MKNKNRWLSILMCLCLLCTSMLGELPAALAESGEAYAASMEGVGAELPQSGLTESAQTAQTEGEPELELMQDAPQTADEAPLDTASGAERSEAPEFTFGYARTKANAALYAAPGTAEDALATILKDEAVLAIERRAESGTDWMEVVFVYDGAAEKLWMEADLLSPMTEAEIEAFQQGVMVAVCYQDDPEYPLPEVKLVLPEDEQTDAPADAPDAEADASATSAPEQTETSGEPQKSTDEAPADAKAEKSVLMQTVLYAADDEEAQDAKATMRLESDSATIAVGETAAIRPIFSDGVNREVSYLLSKQGVVSVAADGTVKAVAAGEVDITVKCAELDNASAVFHATVVEPSDGSAMAVGIEEAEIEQIDLMVGEKKSIAVAPPEGAEGSVQYALSAQGIAELDESGMLTGVREGDCTVTASLAAGDGSKTELVRYQVKVYALPEALNAALTDELDVGQTAQVGTELEEYPASKLTYESSDSAVAAVDESGRVTAAAAGKCTITVKLETLSCALPLTVYAAPDSFELTISRSEVNAGETAQLSVKLPEYTRGTVSYSSDNPAIAAVDQTGLVLTAGAGSCLLTATVGTVSRSVGIIVYGKPDRLNLTIDKTVLAIGYRAQASVSLPEYVVAEIEYSSSDASVAEVDADGVVTALSAGKCEIIAAADNGISERVEIEVREAALDLSEKYYDLAVGQSFELGYMFNDLSLEAEEAVFSSSDETRAKVDPATGVVTAVAEGEAVITLTLGDTGVSADCFVTVHPEPTRVAVTGALKTIGKGQITEAIGYILYAGEEPTIGSVTFSSSNTKVVKVNSLGQMLGVAAGSATVRITAYNGKSASFKVTVTKAPSSLSISPTSASLAVGQTGKISCTLTKNTVAGITYASSDEEVATVSDTGVVTAVGVGSCQIRVSTHNGLAKTSKITVTKAPENVTLKLSAEKLGVSMTATSTAAVDTTSSVRFGFTYWTDAPEVISVDEATGAIKALKPGSASVFVKTYNGVSSHEEDGGRVETCAQVTVVPNPEELEIGGTEFNIIVGRVIKLPVSMKMSDGSTECMTTYALSTSNAKVAAVNASGQIKGVKAGTATITVTTGNGLRKTCRVIVRNKPTRVRLNASSGTLGVGMTFSLKANIYYSSSAYFTYSAEDALGVGYFVSSDPAVLTVDDDGLLTAVSKGTATVTFKTWNGKSASCKVTVKGVPTALSLDQDVMKLGVGMTGTLKPVFQPDELGEARYTSSDAEVASVDQNGKVTAKAMGTATITAETGDGVAAACEVRVVPAPEVLAIDGAEFNVIVGNTIELPILMSMKDGSTDCMTSVKLTTSSAKIAAVDSAGRVRAVKAGTATIRVTTANNLTATCRVVVRSKPTKVKLNASSGTLGVGMTYTLKAAVYYSSSKYFTYSSTDALGVGQFYTSNPDVLAVDAATGEMTALQVGTASVMFKTTNGKSAICKVTVKPAPTSVKLDQSQLKLGEQMTSALSATFNEGAYGTKEYSTGDPSVATVSSSGVVTAVGVGRTEITVTTLNGVSDACEVEVVHAPDKVELNISSSNMAVKGSIALKASYSYQGGDDCMAVIAFKSSNTKVATVTSAGVVKALKTGTATIRAYDQAGNYADCKIVVRKAPTKVQLGASSVSLGVGQRIRVTGKIFYSGGSCAFSPNDTSYARLTVDDSTIAQIDAATGEVIGVEVGKTKVRLQTYNGKSAACTVIVAPGPEWIAFDDGIANLSVGESMKLTCQTSPGSISTISYTSSDTNVVRVGGSGAACTINAMAYGSATITAISSNGCTSTCEVTVMARPEKVEFAQSAVSIGIHETARLPRVSVTSSTGECSQAVAYSVSGSAVQLASPGYVTGVSAGTAVVTASTYDGQKATCTVTVNPEPTVISVVPAAPQLNVGDSTELIVKMDAQSGVTFSVDDPEVIEVSEDGEATALSIGTAKITATAYNGLEASCTIQVLPSPDWVKLSDDAVTMCVGSTETVSASVPEGTLGTVAFASQDASIAAVDANGVITAKAAGETVIRAYIAGHSEVFDTCVVTVQAKATGVRLSADALTLRRSGTAALTAQLYNDDGSDCFGSVRFASSAPGVAAVDAEGVVRAVAAGEAVITASLESDSSVSAACKVVVLDSRVGFDVEEVTLSVGETYALRIDLPDGKDGFSIASDNDGVARVSEDGVISAVAQGSATITAKNGGDMVSCAVMVTSAPTGLQLSVPEKRLVIGQSFMLEAVPQPQGTACAVTFKSSDARVAAVSEDGCVEAVGYGTAVIRVASKVYPSSVYAECTVTCVYEPEMIRFAELDEIVIAAGDSYTLKTPKMYNAGGDCDSTYTLAISNPDCARISVEEGRYVIRALSEGTTSLRLKTANGKTASQTVIVVEEPTSIRFEDGDVIRMALGEDYQPTLLGNNGARVTAALSSASEQVVSVTADGALRANALGTATVKATSKQFAGLTAQVTVEVLNVPESMELSEESFTLAVGERFELKPEFSNGAAAANIEFESSDEGVVHVSDHGLVCAVGTGTAVVKASAINGCSAECRITVKAEPTVMSVSPSAITACVKDRVPLTAAFGGENEYANLMFESTDPSVAQVSADGVVTFKSVGEAMICVETFNGLSAEVPVVVCETPTGVGFDLASAVILQGDTARLKIEFLGGQAYYSLESSDPEIVSVSGNDEITAHKLGTATISLKAAGANLSAKCTVTVVDALDGVALTADKTTLELNESAQLSYTLSPANAIGTGLVTFSSSDSAVAAVDESGVVTGLAYGTAVITATTGDGKTGACEINVLGGKRRMLIAYYFGEPGDSGYLPFAYNNGYSMSQAFSAATVEGQSYSIAGPMSNAPKSELFGAIESHFADATDDDVSVIYICAHGSRSYGPTGEYAFALDRSHYVMASELMNRLERIKGHVVLIMDSCHSGGIIDCNRSRLDAAGGRISVIASSHRETSSCYWSVSQKLTSVDFYTHALLQGVGFNEADGIGGSRGWFRSTGGPADDEGNGDGQITIEEMFNYAKKVTVANVATYKGYPQFCGDPAQVPQSYITGVNQGLVLFAR